MIRRTCGVAEGHLRGDVAAQRIVRGRLVRDHVEALAGLRPRRLDLRRVADERDRQGVPGIGRLARHRERLLRGVREPVHVADLVAAPGAGLVHLDRDADALVHRHRQRLGAAHPAQAGGQDHLPAQGPAEVLARQLRERLVRALEDPLGADVDPGPRGHLAVHHQALPLEVPEDVPVRPLAHEVGVGDEHARAPTRSCGRPPPACRTGRGASRRRRGCEARARWRRTRPSCGPRARCRRRRPARPGSRPPPGPGCSSASAARLPAASRGWTGWCRAGLGRGAGQRARRRGLRCSRHGVYDAHMGRRTPVRVRWRAVDGRAPGPGRGMRTVRDAGPPSAAPRTAVPPGRTRIPRPLAPARRRGRRAGRRRRS